MEVHSHPEDAMSDGAQSLLPSNFNLLMQEMELLAKTVKREL